MIPCRYRYSTCMYEYSSTDVRFSVRRFRRGGVRSCRRTVRVVQYSYYVLIILLLTLSNSVSNSISTTTSLVVLVLLRVLVVVIVVCSFYDPYGIYSILELRIKVLTLTILLSKILLYSTEKNVND